MLLRRPYQPTGRKPVSGAIGNDVLGLSPETEGLGRGMGRSPGSLLTTGAWPWVPHPHPTTARPCYHFSS